jgi:hypothetical protein|tara:strand:- start:643 stop:1110 length:468 start_codon:yes stop_codon:yes gene_type:complete
MKVRKSDLGTPERVKSEIYRDEAIGLTAGSPKRRRVLSQTPIDRYYQRKQISERQYSTALYLYSVYYKSSKSAGINYNPRVDSSSYNTNEHSAVGKSDYLKAMNSLDKQLFSIVQYCVIFGCTAGSFDEINGIRRVSMSNLRAGLDKLADYFRIS